MDYDSGKNYLIDDEFTKLNADFWLGLLPSTRIDYILRIEFGLFGIF